MKIQNLRFFVAVIDQGGVVKAAEHLHVSQPAVSAGLKALEQELGAALFERGGNGRRLQPTAKAMAFHRSAVDILRQCDAARRQFAQPVPRARKLRIGVLSTIASGDVANLASALSESDPDLRVQISEASPIILGQWLRAGRIDVAWTVIDRATKHARILWQEPFVLLAGRMHRFGSRLRGKIALSDLDGEAIVLRGACEMRRGQLWPDSVRMRIAARAERDELALKLVAQGAGIAIAPRSLASEEVVVRKVEDLDATRSIGVKWRSDLAPDILASLLAAMSGVRR